MLVKNKFGVFFKLIMRKSVTVEFFLFLLALCGASLTMSPIGFLDSFIKLFVGVKDIGASSVRLLVFLLNESFILYIVNKHLENEVTDLFIYKIVRLHSKKCWLYERTLEIIGIVTTISVLKYVAMFIVSLLLYGSNSDLSVDLIDYLNGSIQNGDEGIFILLKIVTLGILTSISLAVINICVYLLCKNVTYAFLVVELMIIINLVINSFHTGINQFLLLNNGIYAMIDSQVTIGHSIIYLAVITIIVIYMNNVLIQRIEVNQ